MRSPAASAERALLGELLEPGGPVVAYVHGLAGVGKSTLLRAFAADARAAGAAVVEADAHTFYPHAGRLPRRGRGPRCDAGRRAGRRPRSRSPPRRSPPAATGSCSASTAPSCCAPLDDWLCRTFVPALPAHVRVVRRRARRARRPLAQLRAAAARRRARQPAAGGRDRAAAARRRRAGRGARHQPDRARPPARACSSPPGRCATGRTWRSARSPPARSARSWRARTSTGSTRRRGARSTRPRSPAGPRARCSRRCCPDDDGGAYERLRALPVRDAGRRRARRARHGARGDRRAAARGRPERVLAAARRRLEPPARRSCAAPRRASCSATRPTCIYLIENRAVRDVFFPPAADEHGARACTARRRRRDRAG